MTGASPSIDPAGPSFARRTAALSIGQATVKGSQLVVTVLLVRLLAPGEWTRAAYLLSIYLAAVTIGTLNLQHTLVFFARRLSADQQRALVVRTAGWLLGISATIAGALMICRPILTGGRLDVGDAIPFVALAVLLEVPAACAPVAFLALDRVERAAMWDVTMTLVHLACVVGATWAWRDTHGTAVGLAVAAAARMAGFVALVVPSIPGRLVRLPKGTIGRQLRYGLPLGLALATSVLNRSVDKWLIAVFDTGNVGVYSVAAQEIPLLAVLPYAGGAAMAAAMVDAFDAGDRAGALQLWLRLTGAMSPIVVPVAAVTVVAAPTLFVGVFRHEFAAGVLPFQLFTAISLHRVAEYGLVLRAADRTDDLLWASAVLLGANAVLAGIGAAVAGMTGAAAGTLVANAVAWVFVLGRLGRAFSTPIRDVFAWRIWTTAVACAAASAGTAGIAARLSHATSEVARLVTQIGVFAVTYLTLAHVAGVPRSVRQLSSPSDPVLTGRTPGVVS